MRHVNAILELVETQDDYILALLKKIGFEKPYFSTNPTFRNSLKNTTSYLAEAGFSGIL